MFDQIIFHTGFDPRGVVEILEQLRRECLIGQPFPRIELEQRLDCPAVEVDEARQVLVPAKVTDEDRYGSDPRRLGGVAHIARGHRILARIIGDMRDVKRVTEQRRQLAPFVDQSLMQAVELVKRGEDLLLPRPLNHCRLQQRGRRVAVELEQLGRPGAVIAEVEPAEVERRRLGVPGVADRLVKRRRDREPIHQPLIVDDRLSGGEEQPVQLGRRGLDRLDLGEGEAVAGALVPIALAGCTVPDQSLRLNLALPVGARRQRAANQDPDPPDACADDPKPPRLTALARLIAVDAGARK